MKEIWKQTTVDGETHTATIEDAWDNGWWVDMGCSLWNKWYKRKANAEKYLQRCGYEREVDTTADFKMVVFGDYGSDIKVIYTGGGIWLALTKVDAYDHVYAVVDNDFDECITFYDDRGDDYEYACQQMVDSRGLDEMNGSDRVLWEMLHKALERKGVVDARAD